MNSAGCTGPTPSCWAYAIRDTDGDGIHDYRVSEFRGKFFEGDVDVDGDGIRNVYDAAPYDPEAGGIDENGDGLPDVSGSFADGDADGIPNHIDWTGNRPDAMASLQLGLFEDFGVILVQRSAIFTPDMVMAIDDALRLVFREPMSALRTIALEDQLLISPDLGDNGLMRGQTQTLTILTTRLNNAPPLVLLGLVVHEIGHAWQLSIDYDQSHPEVENTRVRYPHGEFTSSLEQFGWAVEAPARIEASGDVLFVPHFLELSPDFSFDGMTPAEWQDWFDNLQNDDGYLTSEEVTGNGLVGPLRHALTLGMACRVPSRHGLQPDSTTARSI